MSTIVRRSNPNAIRNLIETARSMGLNKVEVGLPKNTGHTGTDLSMAELGAVHEFGSPTRNIPARPFIEPSIKDNLSDYKKMMRKQAPKILLRRISLNAALSLVGEKAKADMQQYLLTANFTPLAPATIAAKGSSKPLIDTGQMRNAITYEIK